MKTIKEYVLYKTISSIDEYLLSKDNPKAGVNIDRVPMDEIWRNIQGSFHDCIVIASVNDLTKVLGKPERISGGEADKTRYEWGCKCDRIYFYIYDYKEPHFTKSTVIEFHIGTEEKEESEQIIEFLKAVGLDAQIKKYPWS